MACAYSPDGTRIVSASVTDKTIKVWDAITGMELATLFGHTEYVLAVAYSPDGKHIASGSMDGTVKIWDAITGSELTTFTGHALYVNAVTYSPDGIHITSGASDKDLKIWDVNSRLEPGTLDGHTKAVHGVAYSTDGTRIVSASADKTLKVWDANTGTQLTTLPGHTAYVNAVACSPDGSHIVSGSIDGTLKIWDAASGAELATLTGHTNSVWVVTYSPNGRRIASGSLDGTLKVWDTTTYAELDTFSGQPGMTKAVVYLVSRTTDQVRAVAYSPDGERIVCGSFHEVKILDANTGKRLGTLTGHMEWVSAVAYSPDGARIVTASGDKTLKVWDVATEAALMTLTGHTDWVHAVAYSPDGSHIVSGSKDKTLKVWDVEQMKCVATMACLDEVICCRFNTDGTRICCGDGSGTVYILELRGLLAASPHKSGCNTRPGADLFIDQKPTQKNGKSLASDEPKNEYQKVEPAENEPMGIITKEAESEQLGDPLPVLGIFLIAGGVISYFLSNVENPIVRAILIAISLVTFVAQRVALIQPLWASILIMIGLLTMAIKWQGMYFVVVIILITASFLNIFGGTFAGWTLFGIIQLLLSVIIIAMYLK